MNKKTKNIYLIDGNALCYRAFYAIRELTTSKGKPTNAIYGFINILKKIMREYDPQHLAVIFDTPVPTQRHKKYEQYKIHRKPMPDDLVEQIPRIKDVIRAYNIPVWEEPGYEADDIIATLAERSKADGVDVVIVTSDKDAMQLVDKKVRILNPATSVYKFYDSAGVVEKFGVEPDKMIELMALIGDASDNVPGVKGVGKVTATKLIGEYGSVNGVYENIDNIKSASLKKKLEEGREMAQLSRELVILDRKVPVDADLAETVVTEPDVEELTKLFKEFEFGKLLMDIAPKVELEETEYITVDSESSLKMFKSSVETQKTVYVYVASLDDVPVAGIAICCCEGESFYIPYSEVKKAFVYGDDIIKTILSREHILKVGYDLKVDMRNLKAEGIEITGGLFDVMIADYLIDPSRPKYDLEGMAMRHLSYNLGSSSEDMSWDGAGQATLDFSPQIDSASLCERVDVISRMYPILSKELKTRKLDELFFDVEMPLVGVIARMEDEGVNVDVEYLRKASEKLEKELKKVTRDIYDLAGEEFNINSPKQLQVILYDKLELPVLKKTKTGRSTDESVLSRLAARHKLPEMLLEYRAMNKLKTAYYDSILSLADNDTGKLHASFNQAVTATGRLSSSDPNLQNIPIRTSMGRDIRRAFIPRSKDRRLLAADYSQIELRVLAHLSSDKTLIGAFKKGEDVHKYTASLIFDCGIKEVTSEMRSTAKTVNFGIVYGISAFGLSKDLGIRIDEAQDFIDAYFERYPNIKAFMEKTIENARKQGYVTTLLNRRRYIPEINSGNDRVKSFAERAAINTPVQGSAADLIKLAMIKCDKEFFGTDVKMTMQVHDELVFDVPEGILKGTAHKVKEIMEGVASLKVPLVVDAEVGENWIDLEEVA